MWPFKRRHVVKIGGQRVEVAPLSLQNVIELSLLFAPYLHLIEEDLPRLKQAYSTKGKSLLPEIALILHQKMKDNPGDISRAVALLIGVDSNWLVRSATAAEIVGCLPVLDRAHDLPRLWAIIQHGRPHFSKEPIK